MLYNPPTGVQDPNGSYEGKDTAAGKQGSRVPPKAVEAPQRELVKLITEAGLTPTNDDWSQVLKAIRSGRLWSYSATGTTNALVITPITPHVEKIKGQPHRIFPLYTNTGEATLQVNQLLAPLVRRDGSPLQAADIVQGVPFDVVYDGVSAFRLLNLAFGEVQRIVAAPTLWVRTDGNDANDGSFNDAARAFATVQAALLAATKFAAVSAVTIRLGNPGTYAVPAFIPNSGGRIIISGDLSNQGNYVLAGSGSIQTGTVILAQSVALTLQGLTLNNTGTLCNTLAAATSGSVLVQNVTFTGVPGNASVHALAAPGGSVTIGAGCIVASSMGAAMAAAGGVLNISPVTVTFAGNPTFSLATVYAQSCGVIAAAPGSAFSGTPVSGARYSASINGVIQTYGAGANFFPGSTAGATSFGGQYV